MFLSFIVPLALPLSLVFLYLGLLVGLAEGLSRFYQWSSESTRKLVHIGAGQVILLAWLFHLPLWMIMTASILAGIIAILSHYYSILPSVNGVGRPSWGTFFYALSIGLLSGYFWSIEQPYYAVIGILVMAWGDGMAGLIGKNFGQHHYQVFGMNKSWEGTLAMMGFSFLVIASILTTLYGLSLTALGIAFFTAILATVMESFSRYGIDNLTVPLSSGMVSFLLVNWIIY